MGYGWGALTIGVVVPLPLGVLAAAGPDGGGVLYILIAKYTTFGV